MATEPRVLFRKVTATRSRKGSWRRRSWTRPNVGEEKDGKGTEEMEPRGGRVGRGKKGEERAERLEVDLESLVGKKVEVLAVPFRRGFAWCVDEGVCTTEE